MNKGALGVDIGNVIINHRPIANSNDETWWNEKYSTIPAADDVWACLEKLKEEKFGDNIFLISKIKEGQELRTLKWLADNNFFERTGIKKENVFFCHKRAEKEAICRAHNVQYFIDDRLEVLSHMIGGVANLYLFQPDPKEVEEFKQFLPKVTRAESWKEVTEKILNI